MAKLHKIGYMLITLRPYVIVNLITRSGKATEYEITTYTAN
ncbi:hypothetical protein IGJ34_000345 [Enterococcus sp. AZ177]